MEWFVRMMLNLPPRDKDIKELKEIAPELFSGEKKFINKNYKIPIYPFYIDDYELREIIKIWLQNSEKDITDISRNKLCDYPYCLKKKDNPDTDDCMQMMTIAGGKEQNLPAKSFFHLIDTTKIKGVEIKSVILTDPYIYTDIGQSGNSGGFTQLLKLLEHLNINCNDSFELQLTPQNDLNKRNNFASQIKKTYPNCIVLEHKKNSIFHDRFIFVQYIGEKKKAWYGPSLNGLNSNSIIIFGDITDNIALEKLSRMLL